MRYDFLISFQMFDANGKMYPSDTPFDYEIRPLNELADDFLRKCLCPGNAVDLTKPLGVRMEYMGRGALGKFRAALDGRFKVMDRPDLDFMEGQALAQYLVGKQAYDHGIERSDAYYQERLDKAFAANNRREIARLTQNIPHPVSRAFAIDRIRQAYPDFKEINNLVEWGEKEC